MFTHHRHDCQSGFTLIELIVAMTILSILTTVGIVGVRKSYKAASEAVLRENLYQLNKCLNQYAADNGHYPKDIKELQEKRYVMEIPIDPITRSNTTWQSEYMQKEIDDTSQELEIFRIRSGSNEIGENGIPYHDW